MAVDVALPSEDGDRACGGHIGLPGGCRLLRRSEAWLGLDRSLSCWKPKALADCRAVWLALAGSGGRTLVPALGPNRKRLVISVAKRFFCLAER